MEPQPPERPTDPRFILANERTLLAWMRTSLAFVATGLALLAVRHAGVHSVWPLVGATVSSVVGALIAGWAYRHWRTLDNAIRSGEQIPSTTIVPLVVLGVVVLAATVVLAVVSI